MGNKTFAEVQDFLKGKIILVANRGIPGRRICRSIRERFDAVAAMTATDVDKTAPAASTAQELVLLGAEPRAYLEQARAMLRDAGCRHIIGTITSLARKSLVSLSRLSSFAALATEFQKDESRRSHLIAISTTFRP